MKPTVRIEKNENPRKDLQGAAKGNCADMGYRSEARPMIRPVRKRLRETMAGIPVLCLAMLSGCSSTTVKPQVGAIVFSDANGIAQKTPPTSLQVNTGTYLYVPLNNDKQFLGADWTVSCSSELSPGTPLPPGQTVDTSCGTFSPVHTASGPVPSYATNGAGIVTFYTAPASVPKTGTVTLFASATADHSRYASVTLSVTGVPISVAFSPSPQSSLAVNGTVSLTAVVNNDSASGGVKWSVTCSSSACGSFSPAQTASAVATTYTAPSSVPTGNTVTITATSVTDSTKSISATITILPLTVTIVPATLSVGAGGTAQLNATVTNDVANAGVDWTLSCGSAGTCGSITAHTASGVAATYTAPSAAPSGNIVTVTATSTSIKTVSATATATVTTSHVIKGRVLTGTMPLEGAGVLLYAAGTSGYEAASSLLNAGSPSLTEKDGSFTISGFRSACPDAKSQLYLIARGGPSMESTNPDLVLMSALGPCGSVDSSGVAVAVNEVTTVAAAYALSGFMSDAAHLGAPAENSIGLENAFAAAGNLVYMSTGEARTATPAGNGMVPQTRIDTIANALHHCAATSGGSAGDGSVCGELFSIAGGSSVTDTLLAALSIAQHPAKPAAVSANLYEMAVADGAYQPLLSAAPEDWSLAIRFSVRELNASKAIAVDDKGDLWIDGGAGFTELDAAGAEVPGSPFANTSAVVFDHSTQAAVADGAGRLWTANPAGSDRAPVSIEAVTTVASVQAGQTLLAVDGSGDLWVVEGGLSNGDDFVTEFLGAATPKGVSLYLAPKIDAAKPMP